MLDAEWERSSIQERDITANDLSSECLTELLSIEKKYTNHSMMATGIMLLKEAKIGDRDIQKLTEHKDERSLNNYDHTNSVSNKADMADGKEAQGTQL